MANGREYGFDEVVARPCRVEDLGKALADVLSGAGCLQAVSE